MAIMNYQYRAFKDKNPNIEATYNVWPLTSNAYRYRLVDVEGLYWQYPHSWSGTYSWWHFTRAADQLDDSIMIANRRYTPEVADYCMKRGRKYGIWSWYTCDQEITASLHVEAERLGREFSQLPDAASAQIEYFAVPSNCHGLNSASLYIAANLLWEPRRDPFEVLKEFCALVFGPRVSEPVYLGYSAIARIRNHDVDGDSAFYTGYLGAGTDRPDKDARMSARAMRALKGVEVDKGWVSKIPMAVQREEMLEDLKDHVRMIHQYALFRTAYAKLAQQERISAEDVKNLPKVDKLSVSGGMIEWRKAQTILRVHGYLGADKDEG
jgi:hypothetical protein